MDTAHNKSRFFWAEYFSTKKTGGHKYSTEEFLSKEASEMLFHLGGGKTLLDFGCAAGELLIYNVPNYERVVGVDFSSSMLHEAEKRINQQNYKNVDLILADDKTVWSKLNLKFRLLLLILSQCPHKCFILSWIFFFGKTRFQFLL